MFLNTGKTKNKNRRRLDIVRDVLSIASVKVRKTKIMYQSNLSYIQVEKYLKGLLESGLVERDGDSHYLITGKGKEFLQMYADYLDLCRRIEEDIQTAQKDKVLLENMCFIEELNSKRMPDQSNRKEILV